MSQILSVCISVYMQVCVCYSAHMALRAQLLREGLLFLSWRILALNSVCQGCV